MLPDDVADHITQEPFPIEDIRPAFPVWCDRHIRRAGASLLHASIRGVHWLVLQHRSSDGSGI